MPQYLAPGVYVEELPGPRTIEGVSTSTAAFVGPTRTGPVDGRPELLTSYADFARIYGDAADLTVGGAPCTNYVALGAMGFFDEGGSSLYVIRTFTASAHPTNDQASTTLNAIAVQARFPGRAGAVRVTFTLNVGNNVVVSGALTRVREYDVVWVKGDAAYVVRSQPDGTLFLTADGTTPLSLASAEAYPLTVTADVQSPTVNGQGLPSLSSPVSIGEFGLDPRGGAGALSNVLATDPPTRNQALTVPVALDLSGLGATADTLAAGLATAIFGSTILSATLAPATPLSDRQVGVTLDNGTDGAAPDEVAFEAALAVLESIDDVSIVAAPGASSGWGGDATSVAQAINGAVTTHCERLLYRVAALDTPAGSDTSDALDFRNLRSSEYAALYYPWVTISHPVDGSRVSVPPAAYMAGIWARTDSARGVFKAPANEVIRSALDLEIRLNKAQQELLNPEGVNCLRFFPGPGFLVWGARTVSDDPEWKYLSIRRYFNYLEKSIDQGTQWVVFEVNGPALWDAVRHTVEGFLLNEWRSGALLGAKPEQGFFVRCDASTMTADDLDNGRLVCVIGVAAAKPAEFVIFRISQITAPTTS
jgi:uncharacterized protein